jgi:DNA-binding CsgD family transcriptional regulator
MLGEQQVDGEGTRHQPTYGRTPPRSCDRAGPSGAIAIISLARVSTHDGASWIVARWCGQPLLCFWRTRPGDWDASDLSVYGRPLAIIVLADIVLADPDQQSPSQSDLAEFFRLSPVESRLAVALLAGKTLREIALDRSVQIGTLRIQLSSILRKAGVTRQVDLIRLLSGFTKNAGNFDIHAIPSRSLIESA